MVTIMVCNNNNDNINNSGGGGGGYNDDSDGSGYNNDNGYMLFHLKSIKYTTYFITCCFVRLCSK